MHISMTVVLACAVVFSAWSILALYGLRRARLIRRRRQNWKVLKRRYPDLDRELDDLWQRL
jgi:hypothetical protein